MVAPTLTLQPSQQVFARLAAKLPYVKIIHHDLALLQRHIMGFKLKQVRKLGWQYDWSQTLTAVDIEQLANMPEDWHYFKAVCPPGMSACLQQALSNHGLTAYIAPFQQESVVNLSEGWDTYWQTRTHNHKRDMQRRMNKLTKAGFRLNPVLHPQQLNDILGLFFDWHQSYWQQRQVVSAYADPQQQALLSEWLQHLLAEGQLWGMVLMVEDQPAAISLGMRSGDQVQSLLSVYDEKHAKLSPGSSLLYLEMQYAAKHGVTTFWLGPGENFQKSRWHTEVFTTQVMLVPNPKSRIGRFMVAYKLLTREFSEMNSLPSA
jgi:Acetyltransferase (GNAT) domain